MNKRPLLVTGIILAGFFVLISPIGASAANFTLPLYDASGLVSQTFTKSSSPYLLPNCADNTLPAGRTLTIEAGAVVKFGSGGSCGVPTQLLSYGNLAITGTAEEPVIFTSWYDDAAAGDTNVDVNVTKPQSGDWGRVQLGNSASSSVEIEHAIFRYGGNASLGMLQFWSPIAAIHLNNLEIASSSHYGLTTFVPLEIHHSSFHDNRSAALNADPAFGLILPEVNATNNWWGDASGPRAISNPNGKGEAIFGNVLYDPWIGKETKQDPVIIIPGILGSAQKNGVWVIDPIFHTYDDLIDTLKANGYTEGQDLFTFPYDWREGNVTSSLLLKDKINGVQEICQCAKVDLVAHSMGGLIARHYIQSDGYENDVDQLIFLGTPHLGAPKTYLTWEGGIIEDRQDGFGILDRALRFVFYRDAQKAGFSGIFDYVRNRPLLSVQDLLPIYDYLRDKSIDILRTYPINYPVNPFLENLNGTISTLFNSGVRLTNIVGDSGTSSTLHTLRVVESTNPPLWEHGYPDGFDGSTFDRGLESGSGDETVPSQSSEFIESDLYKLLSGHRILPTKAESHIFKKLTGADALTLITRKLRIDFKLLIIKILSPIDVLVIAPDGKRVGKDFQTAQEVNEIEDAFYSGFLTDDEFVSIPNPLDGEYIIQTQGTDNGSYTIAVGYMSDETLAEEDFTGQTAPNLITELKLTVNNAVPEVLEIKTLDIVPPKITVTSPEPKDYPRSELLQINFIASDAASGVSSREAKFDDRIVNNGETIDLLFEKLGPHQFSVRAGDFLGNTTSTAVNLRVTATLESTIKDIKRAHSLGWINKLGIKNRLINQLKKIIRQEKKATPKTLKKFINLLEKEHPKNINDQAYNLLKEDINWLLDN